MTASSRPVPKAAKARIEQVGDGFLTDTQLLVTLQRGWSFTAGEHAPVAIHQSYDSAMSSIDQALSCECADCLGVLTVEVAGSSR